MGESSGSVSIDVGAMQFGGKEHVVRTSKGSVSVLVFGDERKPALVTYPDVGLNYESCFHGLFFCPDADPLLLQNFCVYHMDAPGHQLGADVIASDVPVLSVDDLADQVAEVIDHFGLKKVFCLGVTAGAYVLMLFAAKYGERVLGLILVSPICKAPSWTEWLYNKVLLNLLYFYGMCGLLKECLLQRYFSKELRCVSLGSESDVIQTFRRFLGERQGLNVMRFLDAMNRRHDLTEGLDKLQCKTLIFVGENSPFYGESVHINTRMDRKACALVEVQGCGSLVTEEHPYAMLIPIELFLMGYGYCRTSNLACSRNMNRSNHSLAPSCHPLVAPELLSLESLGIKLKPIKTRVDVEA
ncbi:hypothetical protein MLD38_035942 [Melastoma candidum]|uniref:Uncharacterized protein n=1 Tax=Melastoma candidum TaxID=119954 RepID=A0ACB9LHN4_9MYRT|nr:hypothetical protein MLD38_035942 [Melastoma candidum]